ncbi:efflux transporter outer membrane subunit [Novosphingobium pentaromativorans]|uniref:RND efflux system outer membrane lipoprotein n=1 Tax=Novosphingobium pentaromativorans US6-1 TaxID=1088721 RepID=G6EE34_9SPHN|nr:efflux transporter outer membrane subunit [Novosphingobium pentaromativorans]AIT79560.1 transporter [Novosphingobium pentaromativorans US6-1]EHJ60475.1 RND efflux system outer membrane lipoprotein [Novosphingobium pentaromativorans US6-1]
MNRTTRSLWLCSALALAGCNMAPKYVRPDLPVPADSPAGPAYDEISTQSSTQGSNQGSAQDLAGTAWEDFFTDDRLRAVIRTALSNNRDLRISLANVEQARSLYKVQRADLLPGIAASGSATYQKSTGQTAGQGGAANLGGAGRMDIYSASVGVSAWELDLFGRVRNLTKSAQEDFFAAQANRDAAQVALVAEVASAWLALAADSESLAFSTRTAQAYDRTVALTEARFKAGVASQLEVSQARTSRDQARSDIAALTTQVAQDRNALELLAGTSLDPEVLPGALPDDGATIGNLPANVPSSVLLQRPDIAAAEHQLIGANADIGAARAAFFPRISLTAALGTMSMGLSNLFKSGSETWSVAPAASLPIFDFGKRSGNLRYAKATRDAMVAQYEKSVQTAFREVADALARRGTIDAQLEAQLSLRDNAREANRLSEARFSKGVDSFLTTLDSQRSYYAAEQSLIATRLVRGTNAIDLFRALGGGLD